LSGPWARILVNGWKRTPPKQQDFASWLAARQLEWQSETREAIAKAKKLWYLDKRKEWRGDAAFVGLELVANPVSDHRHVLRGLPIGDTVVFLLRNGTLLNSFPLKHSSQFSNIVQALPSEGQPLFPMRPLEWEVSPGDEVIVATDALAKWILENVE